MDRNYATGERGEERSLTLPLTREMREELKAGDRLLLSGRILTARDQAHRRMVEAIERGDDLPVDLEGQVVYYAGPSPAPDGKQSGSVGPTTASRMDPYTPQLASRGVTAFIGKGPRSPQVLRCLREHGALYLVAVGGAAALLGSRVRSSKVVAYPELGPEAIHQLEVEDFPVIVGNDLRGGYIFKHLETG